MKQKRFTIDTKQTVLVDCLPVIFKGGRWGKMVHYVERLEIDSDLLDSAMYRPPGR